MKKKTSKEKITMKKSSRAGKFTLPKERVPLANRIIEGGLLLLVVGCPLLFSIWSKNNFLLPKTVFAEVILTVLFGVWLIKVVERGRLGLVRNEIVLPSLIFLTIAFISLIRSVSLYLSLFDLGLFLSYFLTLFLTMNFIRREKQKTRFFWALVVVCLISSTYAVCQYYDLEFSFWARQGGRGNIFSTFGNPNRYSGFVSAVVPAMVSYFLINRGIRKIILAIVIPLTYTGVLMTFTRGAWAGLALGVLLMIILWVSFQGLGFFRRYAKSIVYILIMVAVISSVFATKNPLNRSRFTIGERTASAVSGREGSVIRRPLIWKIALMMVRDSPIIGKGVGTFKYHYLDYQGRYFANPKKADELNLTVWAREAHDEYVQIWAEMGTLGLFAFLWLLFSFFRGRIKSLKEISEEKQILKIGFTMGVLVILVHGIFSFPLHIIPNGILLFLLMGLSL